jgi:hypothetical protein
MLRFLTFTILNHAHPLNSTSTICDIKYESVHTFNHKHNKAKQTQLLVLQQSVYTAQHTKQYILVIYSVFLLSKDFQIVQYNFS